MAAVLLIDFFGALEQNYQCHTINMHGHYLALIGGLLILFNLSFSEGKQIILLSLIGRFWSFKV